MKSFLYMCVLAGLVAFSSSIARAQALGAGAGMTKIENTADSALFLTGNLRLKLVGPIFLEPEVGYWKKTESGLVSDASSEDLSLGANGIVVLPAHPIELFGGAGVGAHFIDRHAGFAGLTSSSNKVRIGLHVLAGLDFRVSDTLNFFGAARGDFFRDQGSDEEPRQTKLYGGLRFKF